MKTATRDSAGARAHDRALAFAKGTGLEGHQVAPADRTEDASEENPARSAISRSESTSQAGSDSRLTSTSLKMRVDAH